RHSASIVWSVASATTPIRARAPLPRSVRYGSRWRSIRGRAGGTPRSSIASRRAERLLAQQLAHPRRDQLAVGLARAVERQLLDEDHAPRVGVGRAVVEAEALEPVLVHAV